MSMTNDPPDLEPKRRTLMLHSLLEVTTEEEKLGGNLIEKLSVLTVIRRVIRKLNDGQKKVEKKGKDQEQSQRRIKKS